MSDEGFSWPASGSAVQPVVTEGTTWEASKQRGLGSVGFYIQSSHGNCILRIWLGVTYSLPRDLPSAYHRASFHLSVAFPFDFPFSYGFTLLHIFKSQILFTLQPPAGRSSGLISNFAENFSSLPCTVPLLWACIDSDMIQLSVP